MESTTIKIQTEITEEILDEKWDILNSPEKPKKKILQNFNKKQYNVFIQMGKEYQNNSVSLQQIYGNPDSEIFTVKFSQDDQIIAAGLSDGTILIYNLRGELLHQLNSSTNFTPVTSLRWRTQTFSEKIKNILLATNSDGQIIHYHFPSGKELSRLREPENSILCLDQSPDGKQFATSGKDQKIRIYDEVTKTQIQELGAGNWQYPGHSNRVFSLKYLSEDYNILISGGWDSDIYIWDTRYKKSIGSIYGPQISGDSIDYQDGKILTGSYRNKDQIQLWDFRQRTLIQNIDWEMGYKYDLNYIYSDQFQKNSKNLIMVGSCGINEVKLFDQKNKFKTFCGISGFRKGIYSVDWTNNSNYFAAGGGSGLLYVFKIDS